MIERQKKKSDQSRFPPSQTSSQMAGLQLALPHFESPTHWLLLSKSPSPRAGALFGAQAAAVVLAVAVQAGPCDNKTVFIKYHDGTAAVVMAVAVQAGPRII